MTNLTTNYVYPMTIIYDRYNGAYSGGVWLAFNLKPSNIPNDIHGDDITCAAFWNNFHLMDIVVGRGDTPEQAAKDLVETLAYNNLQK